MWEGLAELCPEGAFASGAAGRRRGRGGGAAVSCGSRLFPFQLQGPLTRRPAP